MEHRNSFLTGFLTGQRLKRWQAGIGFGSDAGGGTDFYDWAAQSGAPPELSDPDAYARFAAQFDGVSAADDGTFLVEIPPVYAYGLHYIYDGSGYVTNKSIFLYTANSPVQNPASPASFGNMQIPDVTGGNLILPSYGNRIKYYRGGYNYLQNSSYDENADSRIYFKRVIPAPLCYASFSVEEYPFLRGQYFKVDDGWHDFSYSSNASRDFKSSISADSGLNTVTISASCEAVRSMSGYNGADVTFTNPVYRCVPTSSFSAARPGMLAGSPVNEQAKTFTNPITGEIISFDSYTYNYQTRTYTLTLPGGNKMDVTFGDDTIRINDLGAGDGTQLEGETMEAMYPDNAGAPIVSPDGVFHKEAFLSGLAAGLASHGI